MKEVAVWIFLLALAGVAGAEPKDRNYSADSYAQVGVGGCSVGVGRWISAGCEAVLNVAGGGEGFVYRGLAIGGEGGYGWINSNFKEGVGIFSANSAYHFRDKNRSKALVPFVTAGYTLLVRDGSVDGFNAGGGATWWLRNRVGLRFEARLHHFGVGPLGANVYMFRVGPSFR